MNTRRGFIGKSVAAVAAMFGVGAAASGAEPGTRLHRVVRGFWPSAARSKRLDDIDLVAVCKQDINKVFNDIGCQISAAIKEFIAEGCNRIIVLWTDNISNEAAVGRFTIIGSGNSAAGSLEVASEDGVFKVQQKAWPTDHISVECCTNPVSAAATFCCIASQLNQAVGVLMKGKATRVEIRWLNIHDRTENPLGQVGLFYLLGRRVTGGMTVDEFEALPKPADWHYGAACYGFACPDAPWEECLRKVV